MPAPQVGVGQVIKGWDEGILGGPVSSAVPADATAAPLAAAACERAGRSTLV